MDLKQQLIRAIIIPEETWQKVEKAEEVCDEVCLKLLDFITNKKSTFSILYGDEENIFVEFTENKENMIEYTKKDLLKIFKQQLK